MENGFDRNAPATKGDIQDLTKGLEDFKVKVNTRLVQFEHRMEQFLSDRKGRIISSTYRLAESLNSPLN